MSVAAPQNQTTQFVYDALGNRTERTLPNGVVTAYTYNTRSQLKDITHRAGTTVLAFYHYELDAAGNRRSVTEADNTTIAWQYDAASRLTAEEWSNPATSATLRTEYAYDAVGNRLSERSSGITKAYAYNALDQVASVGSTQYTYDGRGNLLSDGTTNYNWDARNRLVGVQVGTNGAAYTYDADGRRAQQRVGGQTTNYLWDEQSSYSDVVLETDGSGTTQASYVLGGAEILSQQRGGANNFFLTDGQGSVRLLMDLNGAITDRYRYNAYGATQERTGSTVNSYQYGGQQRDALTGLYNLRARQYNPTDGRFLSRDTFGLDQYDPTEWNRYGYARANPLLFKDPTGLNTAVAVPAPRGIGGPMGEYAMVATLAIGTAAGVAALGQSTHCVFSLTLSVFLGAAKDGPGLLALEPTVQPQCIIPIHKVDVPPVSFHVAFAQFFRGKPMLLNYWGPESSYPRPFTRRQICAPIRPIVDFLNGFAPMPPGDQWSCDEYPFYSTIQGGVGSSLMPMSLQMNVAHGRRLNAFYQGANYQGRPIPPGGLFAAVPI